MVKNCDTDFNLTPSCRWWSRDIHHPNRLDQHVPQRTSAALSRRRGCSAHPRCHCHRTGQQSRRSTAKGLSTLQSKLNSFSLSRLPFVSYFLSVKFSWWHSLFYSGRSALWRSWFKASAPNPGNLLEIKTHTLTIDGVVTHKYLIGCLIVKTTDHVLLWIHTR